MNLYGSNDRPESHNNNKLLSLSLPERDHVPSLLLAVMVPGDRVHFQHLRHFHETAEVYALAERHGQPLVDHRALAHAPRRVGHVLQEPAKNHNVCLMRRSVIVRLIIMCSLTRAGRVCRSWSVCPIRNTGRGRTASSCHTGECTLTSIFVGRFRRKPRTEPCAGKTIFNIIYI